MNNNKKYFITCGQLPDDKPGDFRRIRVVDMSVSPPIDVSVISRNQTEEEVRFECELVKCKKIHSNGLVEEGEFIGGTLVKGKRIRPDGLVEEGEFIEGKLAKGKLSKLGETIHEGYFNNQWNCGFMKEFYKDPRHFNGKKIHPDGMIEEGEFYNELIKEGKRIYPNGLVDEGQFIGGKLTNGKKSI